jgi:hypothetical protein
MASCYEHDDEPSSSMKSEEFVDQMTDLQLLRKDHEVSYLDRLRHGLILS